MENELEYMQEIDDTPEELKRSKRIEIIQRLKRNEVTLSHSSFNEFCKSPKHFIDYKLKDKATTPSMAFGSMVHCSILEPTEFESRYFVMPECDGRTKEGKAIKAQAFEDAKGRELVNAKDYSAALRIADSIRKNDHASAILNKCTDFEVDVEWENGEIYTAGKKQAIKWRAKMDGDGRTNKVILDLKVLADVSPRAVSNYVKYEGAGRQAAHYLKNADADCEYFILAVDRGGNCSVSKLGKGLILQMNREIDWYLSMFKKCVFLGDWGASYDFYSPSGYFEINSL
jgi:hypothetical protein